MTVEAALTMQNAWFSAKFVHFFMSPLGQVAHAIETHLHQI